jgi:asparagine synthase (glutamine-hydrolysing)
VPLLDFQVLDFAALLPHNYKVNGWKLKRILKAALKESVPSEILNRKMTGFPVPYDGWMRKEIKVFVFDTILAPNAALVSYFSRKTIAELLQAHLKEDGCSKEVFCNDATKRDKFRKEG